MDNKSNTPFFSPRVRKTTKGKEIFDPVRKKYVILTPEEWVRQQVIHFLVTEQKVPLSHISVETALTYNTCDYRADIVVYNHALTPLLLVECKAENVSITQDTFHQIARYNMVLKVPFLFVSNGKQHYFCRFDTLKKSYLFESKMLTYSEMFQLFFS
jgi:type I site-specific restriction endonuclease